MSDIIERLHGPDGIEAAREITRLREDLASAKQAAAAYEAWKFPEDIQKLTVENERLREENARLAALSAKASLEASQLREALKVAANFLDDAYTDIGRDEYKVAGFVARAAIREGETK